MNKHNIHVGIAGRLCRTGAQAPMGKDTRPEYYDMLPGEGWADGPLDAPAFAPAGGCMWWADGPLFNIVCLDGRIA